MELTPNGRPTTEKHKHTHTLAAKEKRKKINKYQINGRLTSGRSRRTIQGGQTTRHPHTPQKKKERYIDTRVYNILYSAILLSRNQSTSLLAIISLIGWVAKRISNQMKAIGGGGQGELHIRCIIMNSVTTTHISIYQRTRRRRLTQFQKEYKKPKHMFFIFYLIL